MHTGPTPPQWIPEAAVGGVGQRPREARPLGGLGVPLSTNKVLGGHAFGSGRPEDLQGPSPLKANGGRRRPQPRGPWAALAHAAAQSFRPGTLEAAHATEHSHTCIFLRPSRDPGCAPLPPFGVGCRSALNPLSSDLNPALSKEGNGKALPRSALHWARVQVHLPGDHGRSRSVPFLASGPRCAHDLGLLATLRIPSGLGVGGCGHAHRNTLRTLWPSRTHPAGSRETRGGLRAWVTSTHSFGKGWEWQPAHLVCLLCKGKK